MGGLEINSNFGVDLPCGVTDLHPHQDTRTWYPRWHRRSAALTLAICQVQTASRGAASSAVGVGMNSHLFTMKYEMDIFRQMEMHDFQFKFAEFSCIRHSII